MAGAVGRVEAFRRLGVALGVSLSASVVLDPDLASVLLAAAFAGVLALPGLRKKLRRAERACVSCGRRVVFGQRTCDCD